MHLRKRRRFQKGVKGIRQELQPVEQLVDQVRLGRTKGRGGKDKVLALCYVREAGEINARTRDNVGRADGAPCDRGRTPTPPKQRPLPRSSSSQAAEGTNRRTMKHVVKCGRRPCNEGPRLL